MNFLADTHVLLWALTNNVHLSQKARDILLNSENNIYYSFVNVWEVAIKHAMQKPGIDVSAEQFNKLCLNAGYIPLKTSNSHAIAVEGLKYDMDAAPREHRDPFDRLLLAQAKVEGMYFLTHDSLIPYYGEECVVSI